MSGDKVKEQYEVYPYPDRDPKDERRRLITGSPSWPQEMDHWLWGGARDWSQPLRALIAGGGTGDGLIQLAQRMTSAGRPYEITYLDLSTASRTIAEARAKERGLTGIRFETGSLLDAGKFGPFDYIDCCGVLHHLPEPQAGFDALAQALAPGGGMGLMVYAPLGRSGVYPLQRAFNSAFGHLPPAEKLAAAQATLKNVPQGHPFRSNPHLVDHKTGDAGFYDLLLHSTDQPFSITALLEALDLAGLELAGVPEPALYDPADLLPDGVKPETLGVHGRMQLAEDLRGTMKTHVVYAVAKGGMIAPPMGSLKAVPNLKGVEAGKLARVIAKNGEIRINSGGERVVSSVPKGAAPLISGIDGRRTLGEIAGQAGLDGLVLATLWAPVERVLCGRGLMHYSCVLK